MCYVRLEKYREAVEAATKASSIHTWKEVCAACVSAEEYRLAQTCGLHIVKSPDHLEELIQMYARYGQYAHLIELLERSLSEQENAHPGIYTQVRSSFLLFALFFLSFVCSYSFVYASTRSSRSRTQSTMRRS